MSSEQQDQSAVPETDFPTIGDEVDRGGDGVYVIESLCMSCGQLGETRLLLTMIPHFREIILSSFECPHCDARNTEVQFGGRTQDSGVLIVVKCDSPQDLNRQLVKGEYCHITIPEIEFEMPPSKTSGVLTTIEGLLTHAKEDLEELQPLRKIQDPETAQRIDVFLEKLDNLVQGGSPFSLVLRDISGNSHVEYIGGPGDEHIVFKPFERTEAEDQELGIYAHGEQQDSEGGEGSGQSAVQSAAANLLQAAAGREAMKSHAVAAVKGEKELAALEAAIEAPEEVMVFPEDCYVCRTTGELKMMLTSIPFFKEIVLMAFKCDVCGYKSTEVKSGGSISDHGRRIVLKVTNPEDMKRDILKSDTARLEIPEVELKLLEGTLGGMFTSVEGILRKIEEELRQSVGVFAMGDSADPEQRSKFAEFMQQLAALAEGDREFTLIIDDPLANSHVQNPYAPDPDPFMTIEDYVRSRKQDDDLGLLDMKTENYQAEEESGGGSSTSAVRDEAGHGSSSDEGGAGVSQS